MTRLGHRNHKPHPRRSSRHRPGNAELILKPLLDHRTGGFRFQSRVRIEGRIFPFYCAAARLAIVLDNETRDRSGTHDYKFDAYLLARGILVEHFGKKQVRQSPKQVADQILDSCRKRTAQPPTLVSSSPIHPPPPSLRKRNAKPARRVALFIGISAVTLLTVQFFFYVLRVNSLSQGTQIEQKTDASLSPESSRNSADASPIVETPFPMISAERRTLFSPSPILAQAEKYLDSQPQYVVDLLIQNLSQLTNKSDLADAYSYLGRAEMNLKHYQAAAGYFKQLYSLEPSAEYLYPLALAYELGGDWQNALNTYRALADSNGNNLALYRELAKRHVSELQAKHGTPTP